MIASFSEFSLRVPFLSYLIFSSSFVFSWRYWPHVQDFPKQIRRIFISIRVTSFPTFLNYVFKSHKLISSYYDPLGSIKVNVGNLLCDGTFASENPSKARPDSMETGSAKSKDSSKTTRKKKKRPSQENFETERAVQRRNGARRGHGRNHVANFGRNTSW